MAKRGYVKKKKTTNINEKSIQEAKKKALPILGPASKVNELAKQLVGSLSGFDILSGLGPASELGELTKISGREINPNYLGKLVRAEEELKEHVFPKLGSVIRADELAKQLAGSLSDFDTLSGLGPASELGKLAKHTVGEINPSQFGKIVRVEEKLREHLLSSLGSTIPADEFAEQLGISGLSLSDFDTLSGLGPASEFDKLAKLTATGLSQDQFEKLFGVEKELRRDAFSKFCSTEQADELAKQLGMLSVSSIPRTEEKSWEIALSNLALGRRVDEVIQWKKSHGSWIEDEEVTELVDNLSGENPNIDKANEWLESNKDQLTPETLTTMIKTAMERGVSDYVLKLGNKRHATNRALSRKIKEIWVSGKYSSRNRCAYAEWKRLGFNAEKTARNALNNTPDPPPWPAKEK